MRSDDTVTGMATGSDAGAPGDHLPAPPPRPEDLQLLESLQRTGGPDVVDPVESSPEMVAAVEDDGPVDTSGLSSDESGLRDPDDVSFQEP